ncbi:holin (3TMs family) [Rhodovulum bhavnagarense]|uniref:Holin (3TMs family) n=1 Tax=Rhodovulum bhavnagarense TaxID=992286 RepID=A0A4V2SWQ0_9RHOB|nr:holin family protein [Rhodovulum bhavnagarense]TCP63276.1 holin (3TMs family) [Rhodovulum bhavnagarense]
MGLIDGVFETVFGAGRNAIAETAEVFRINADSADARAAEAQAAALAQFAREFGQPSRSPFDRVIDGLNRLPRPALALGTVGLMVAAMVDPVWFATRMQGLSLVPEPLWWLLGAIVSFYFGARHQAKGQEFQRALAATLAQAPVVAQNIAALRVSPATSAPAEPVATAPNAALADWRAQS